MFSRWVFWDASGWVFYIDIFKSGNLEGSSPEREVSADRERRSCLSDSCCEASVIQGENSEGLPREIYSFHFLPPHGFIAVVPASFPLFCPAQVFLMFLVDAFLTKSKVGVNIGEILFLDSTTTGWFYMVFFCWAVESRTVFPVQFSPWQYCLPGYLFQETWNWSYERTLIWFPVLCLVPPPKSFLASSYPDAELQKNSFSTKNSGSQ